MIPFDEIGLIREALCAGIASLRSKAGRILNKYDDLAILGQKS